MKLRKRRAWFEWFKKMAGPICVVGAVMLITAITAHGGALATDAAAVQDLTQAPALLDDAGLAITDTAIAAEDAAHAATAFAAAGQEEGIQRGAEQSVPIATTAVPNIIALKAAPATATITSSIVQAATALAHFQPAALTTA